MSKDIEIPDSAALHMPSVARIYDYLLGGFHNFEMDRAVARKLLEIYPDSRLGAYACRAFLRRVVNFLSEQGIDQFLDIGSGLLTVGHVHGMAQKANPGARVVYVDIDRVAVSHCRALLEDHPLATGVWGDANYPEQILDHEEVRGLLDFGRPVAVLFLTLLNYIVDDEQAHNTVRTFRQALVSGSYMAISHTTYDEAPPGVIAQLEKLSTMTPTPTKYRSRAEVEPFFEELELVEPGLVLIPLWRPEGPDDVFLDEPERSLTWGGVGRKP
jgi:hypothetical protein